MMRHNMIQIKLKPVLQMLSLFFVGVPYPNDMETSLSLSSSASDTSCT